MSFGAVLVSLWAPIIGMAALAGEETVGRPSPRFSSRVQAMLDIQTAVREQTVALDKLIRRAADKKARPKDREVSLKLAEDEKKLVAAATNALRVLESEEAVVALRELVQQLREDMKRVQVHLERGDVGADTQAIEDDILDCLKEMVESLKRG